MFVAIVSFLVNLATALLLFLVSIADLSTSNFFSSFHFLKISFATNGQVSGWLNKPYDFISFGLWSFCEGTAGVTNACIDPKIGYTLEPIPALNDIDQHYVPNAVRSFGKVSILYIPATCVAFLAFVISLLALHPRLRKRWLHALTAFLSLLVTLSCLLLMVVVFTLFGSRKTQFEKHLVPTPAKVSFGPGVWITLALVPLTVFGSLFGAFAVCCPGRFERRGRREREVPESKEEVHEPSA
ncbi:MAG: actin cortical patch SUR7/pH-response regulator pali [Linnemannia elongata]|nr:MAG: actin cortical patch SUR7/pH-response regulator pali [Linnemannia elongata]